MKKLISVFLFFLVFAIKSYSQMVVSNTPSATNGSPSWLVKNILLGTDVTVNNVVLSKGDNLNQIGYFDGSNSNINLPSGIILSTGNVNNAVGISGEFGSNGHASTDLFQSIVDADLTQLIGSTTLKDAVVLEFDFVATRSSYVFNYVFASEEYNEYVNSNYNDVFGFFLSGPGISGTFSNNAKNIALIPNTNIPIAINNVNNGLAAVGTTPIGPCESCTYYVNNDQNASTNSIVYDGFTLPLKAVIDGLQCGKTYHIKIALTDVFDGIFDSAVLLEQGSFEVNGFQVFLENNLGELDTNNILVEGCGNKNIVFTREDTTSSDTIPLTITGSSQLGIDYTALDSKIIFAVGEDRIVIPIEAFTDTLIEGTETFSVSIPFGTGCLTDSLVGLKLLIEEPYEVETNIVNETCGSSNGSITILPHPTLQYNITWEDGSTSFSKTGLAAGNYLVTVSDNAGCSQILSLTINNSGIDSLNINITKPVSCYGICDAEYSIEPVGGTAPYSYFLINNFPFEIDSMQLSVCAGTYLVQVSDANNCLAQTSITISQPDSLFIEEMINSETCGKGNGSICLEVIGGVGSYHYSWSDSLGTDSNCIGNLTHGVYLVSVTDSLGCVKTKELTVNEFNLNCCHYQISLDSIDCSVDTISVALSAIDSVAEGIIGMDFCLAYDTTVISPTGAGNIGLVVGNGAELALNTNVPGYVYGTIYYEAGTPQGTFWNGSGNVACVEFAITNDSAMGYFPVYACGIEESYTLSELSQCAFDGGIYFKEGNFIKTHLYYLNHDGEQSIELEPLMYDAANPSTYLITEMSNTSMTSVATPDLSGQVVWDVNNGDSIKIVRDILGTYGDTGSTCSDVFLVINGQDNYLAALIANFSTSNVTDSSDSEWIPTAYQMIAADVNMNDKVRANDNTLIAQRSVRSICEYPQVWNYTAGVNPMPNGAGKSLDWRFVDKADIDEVDFSADANYPVYNASNATSGYWRDDVPNVAQVLALNLIDSICPSLQEKSYYGVLLGDIDGNFDYQTNSALMKTSSSDKINFIANPIANSSNEYRIQVSYEMMKKLSSMDFRLQYNTDKLDIKQVGLTQEGSNKNMLMTWNDFESNTLYVSSYTLSAPVTTSALYFVDVALNYGSLESTDFGAVTPLLNGKLVDYNIEINNTTMSVKESMTNSVVNVYPNPSHKELNIKISNSESEEIQVVLNNSLGQIIFREKVRTSQYNKLLDVSGYSKGVYTLSVITNGSVQTQKVIVE